MAETHRWKTERAFSCLQQLRSNIQTLEYWKGHQDSEENEWLIIKAIEFLERASKNISNEDLRADVE